MPEKQSDPSLAKQAARELFTVSNTPKLRPSVLLSAVLGVVIFLTNITQLIGTPWLYEDLIPHLIFGITVAWLTSCYLLYLEFDFRELGFLAGKSTPKATGIYLVFLCAVIAIGHAYMFATEISAHTGWPVNQFKPFFGTLMVLAAWLALFLLQRDIARAYQAITPLHSKSANAHTERLSEVKRMFFKGPAPLLLITFILYLIRNDGDTQTGPATHEELARELLPVLVYVLAFWETFRFYGNLRNHSPKQY